MNNSIVIIVIVLFCIVLGNACYKDGKISAITTINEDCQYYGKARTDKYGLTCQDISNNK